MRNMMEIEEIEDLYVEFILDKMSEGSAIVLGRSAVDLFEIVEG